MKPGSQSREPLSPGRRGALKRTCATALSLVLPACGPAGPERGASNASTFANGALRLDLRQQVADGTVAFELERLRFERHWPGRWSGLAEGPDWGDYRLVVHDPGRGTVLVRRGFDTILDPVARAAAAQVSVRMPMPARPVRAALERRRGGLFQEVSAIPIDPSGDGIDRSPATPAARVLSVLAGGDPAAKADLAILGDGYTGAEFAEFSADAARAAGYLFSVEPFRSRRDDFNVNAVFAPSAESGVTDPYLGLSRDTVFRCAYGSGGSERTLAVGDDRAVREAAALVPYDFLLVLANTRRYGGSAYFGGPAVVAIDSAAARYLVVHELAHAMAGLADEYYTPAGEGPVYGGNIEPWQPNVTLSPERAKWRNLLRNPPRPTPWNKGEYDQRFAAYVRRYERLRESGADEAVVEKLMEEERVKQAALLAKSGDPRRPGCFEGANGYAKGMFRAGADCIMFSLQTEYFCAACTAALNLAIDQQTRD